MKKLTQALVSLLLAVGLLLPAIAFAYGPNLTISGNSGNYTLSITSAPANAQIQLYFTDPSSSLPIVINNFGTTDYSGNFSTSIGNGAYGSNTNSQVYVVVGGQQSNSTSYTNNGCTYNCGNPYSLSLSQYSVNLSSGQSTTITATTNGYAPYISSFPQSNIAIASLSGNQITVYGASSGYTSFTVCTNSNNQCATVNVSVSGNCSYNNCGSGSVSFSQNNVVINPGQTIIVTLSGSNGYYISANGSGSVASGSVNGSALTVNGIGGGSTIMTVCSTNGGSCASLYITVNNNGCYNTNCNGSLSVSQNNVTVSSGQSVVISVYNNNGSLYISGNTNSAVASYAISGNQVTIYGNNTGASTITICGNSNLCAQVYVTVTNNGCNYNCSNGSITLSSNYLPVMTLGQYYSYQLQASGGSAPYYFTVANGTLPNGLFMSNSGLLYGTPISGWNSTFSVRITDNYGHVGYGQISVNGNGTNTSGYNNGQLVSINGTVYIVYKHSLTAFSNASAFLGLGFNFSQVITGNYGNIPVSGYVISTFRTAHPWGSWIKNGYTVYFVSDQGPIPVPDWNTFLNNGGQANLIVSANAWDFLQPLQPPMVWNDSRLQ